jgi:hypothetical protein
MKYSIFHTSHCGSTLLASILSKSIPTLTEPSWSHELKDKKDPISYINENHLNGHLVKYSSVYCHLMPQVEGKKVFLYRPLVSHTKKLKNSLDTPFHLSAMTPNLHNKTKSWDMGNTETTIQTLLWMDRCFWAMEAKDLLLIDAKDLFEDQQKVAKKVCRFFEIEYIPVEINYQVKLANLNHSNEPINTDNITNKINYTEPIEPIDFDLLRWVDKIVESHPKLKYFT